MGSDEIFKDFLSSQQFKFESLLHLVHEDKASNYLRCAFDFDFVELTDFKKFSNNEMVRVLVEFGNEPNWGEDKDEFQLLLKEYLPFHEKLGNDCFFISKDWFAQQHKKLNQPESWCYIYYFLIISVNQHSKLISISEWYFD